MKKLSALILLLIAVSTLLAQTKSSSQLFVLSGHLTNYTEKQVWISFHDENGELRGETAPVDKIGNFVYETTNIKTPQEAGLLFGRSGGCLFFAAPGYNLSITGNADDGATFWITKKITGTGSETNKYRIVLDSILTRRKTSVKWDEIEMESDFLKLIRNERKLMDSVAGVVFYKKTSNDQYYSYFKQLVAYEAMFLQLYRMMSFVNRGKCSYEKSVSFLKSNFDESILINPIQDKYLISPKYKDFCLQYATYLANMDFQKDSTLRSRNNYTLEKVGKTYAGKTREYVLSTLMASAIAQSKSLYDLNNYKKQFQPYISTLKTQVAKATINEDFSRTEKELLKREKELLKVQPGKPAPGFKLESNLGTKYTLEDFIGKVVYLDLWASWCVPCRAETPKLKALYAKYKNDNRIAFISIAVADSPGAWQKALKQDKPDWIQLFDKDGIVNDAYVAISIPQFVIIDKQGKIVSLNAPRPGNVEELLLQEMEK